MATRKTQYGVRRNAAWRAVFYRIFEAAKGVDASPSEIFRRSLGDLAHETGRVEASFVSKLVATLNPQAPVIDSVARGYLDARIPSPVFSGGTTAAVTYFDWLSAVFTALAITPEAMAWCGCLDDAFPAAADAVHPVKKLDFLIWAGSRTDG